MPRHFRIAAVTAAFLGMSAAYSVSRAQPVPEKKVLLIVPSYEDRYAFSAAIMRAMQMKRAGIGVEVSFEGSGYLGLAHAMGWDKSPRFSQLKSEAAALKKPRKPGAAGFEEHERGRRSSSFVRIVEGDGSMDPTPGIVREFLASGVPFRVVYNNLSDRDAVKVIRDSGKKVWDQGAAFESDIADYLKNGYIVLNCWGQNWRWGPSGVKRGAGAPAPKNEGNQ